MTNEKIKKQSKKRHFEKYNCEGFCPDFEEGAKWALSQPQIIEIFGKRVKVVKDDDNTAEGCMKCTFTALCHFINRGNLCQSADKKFNRHFVEVDEDGNEIGGEK